MKKDEKKALVDFFNEVSDEYTEAKKKVREAGLEIIKAAVKKHEGQLSLTEIYEGNGREETVAVTYDGGNHPEYANPYSLVNALYIKDGKIAIDCEDCDEYYFDSVTTDEIKAIADFLLGNCVID